MTELEELGKIFKGHNIPQVKVVDFTTSEKERELKTVIKRQQEIRKRQEVNWQKLNSYIIKL
jgi:hypothetical protein